MRPLFADSLAQTATLTSLAFILSSSLNGVSGAPVYGLRATFPETNEMEAWMQPCGTPLVANLRKVPQRHSVHRALKRVRTQLKVAYNYFQKNRKDIHDVYSKVLLAFLFLFRNLTPLVTSIDTFLTRFSCCKATLLHANPNDRKSANDTTSSQFKNLICAPKLSQADCNFRRKFHSHNSLS